MGRSLIPERLSFSLRLLQSGSLCGISTPFGALSRSPGQMSYVLLTRAPLSTDRNRLPVRLACVRHAASVHPEPGSNSPSLFWVSSVFTILLLRCSHPLPNRCLFSVLCAPASGTRPPRSSLACGRDKNTNLALTC